MVSPQSSRTVMLLIPISLYVALCDKSLCPCTHSLCSSAFTVRYFQDWRDAQGQQFFLKVQCYTKYKDKLPDFLIAESTCTLELDNENECINVVDLFSVKLKISDLFINNPIYLSILSSCVLYKILSFVQSKEKGMILRLGKYQYQQKIQLYHCYSKLSQKMVIFITFYKERNILSCQTYLI